MRKESDREKACALRSARTARIEILSAEYLGSDNAVAVRKDRED